MKILVVGVRQKQAAIALREQFALTESQVAEALPELKRFPEICECAILTTCNRTEIYAVVDQTDKGLEAIGRFFWQQRGVHPDLYRKTVFKLLHEDAILHLFRVASGLDSLILGEGQILAQVKDTLSQAQKAKTQGQVLDRLFKTALSVGKRIRTETGIASKDVSVSRAAYQFIRRQEPDLLNKRIALIGGGKMATILMGQLQREMTPEQHANVTILNRSEARLKALTEKYGFRGVGWDAIEKVLTDADVLFVATGAPHVVLDAEDFQGLGPKRVMDISVPRNVDPVVGNLPHVTLYNTDDLEGVDGFSPETQAALEAQAQTILEEEYLKFHQWYMSLSVVPTIAQLKSKVERIRQAEVAALRAISENDAERIEDVSRSLVNKILHEPIARLKVGNSREEISQKAQVLSHLFDIDSEG